MAFDRLSLIDIAAEVASGTKPAVEVAREALARTSAYEAIQPQVWIERVGEGEVLAQAREIDRGVAAGKHLPLAGVPFAVPPAAPPSPTNRPTPRRWCGACWPPALC